MLDSPLPLFPLSLVLLPGEPVPLHIFEPRYKELTRVCLDEQRPFGILRASPDGTAEVGCAARIVRVVTRYPDGRLDLVAAGERRFRIVRLHRDRPYLTADVDPVDDVSAGDAPTADRERVVARHMKLLELAGEALHPDAYAAGPEVSFVVGRRAGPDLDDRQRLLEMTSEAERLRFLAGHLDGLLRRVRRAHDVRELARGDGHAGPPPDIG